MTRSRRSVVPSNQPDWDGLQAGFYDFLGHVTIVSKDEGRIRLQMYDAQRYFFDEIFDGLRRDIHWFVCGKGRQLGITTACLLFDVFYAGAVPDIQAGFVVDTDSNKQKFRKILKEMITTLPATHKLPIAKGGDNREGLTLENGNMLDYLTAGTKRGQGTLGRSRALNFVHATECRSYGDEEALESFKDSLSEIFPWRLYLWESTGYGYNLFYDLWEDAVADELTKMAIFVSWWRKRTYSYRRGTPLFQRYGWKDRSKEEHEAEEIVLASYGHKITDEQWAWYRHRADPIARAEERNDEDMADDRQEIVTQEHPHFPEQMFRGTGSPFIPNEYIAPALHRAQSLVFRGYRYHLGDNVSAMTVVPTKFLKFAQLKVYEPPSPIGTYIVGFDTAYGISDKGDANCIEVVRCFADKMVQVAEFNDRSVQPFQVAWVLLHLCGWYGNCRYVLELNGSGEAVWTELKTLKRMVEDGRLTPPRFDPIDLMEPPPGPPEDLTPNNDIRHAFQHVMQYMYRRADSLGGSGYNYHMRTTIESKFTMMTQFADRFMLGEFIINSVPALEEVKRMRKDGRSIEAEGKAKDDRPIALGLVTRAYIDDERKKLVAQNATYAAEMQREADGAGNDSLTARYMGLIMQQTMAAKGQARRRTERAGRRQRWGWVVFALAYLPFLKWIS